MSMLKTEIGDFPDIEYIKTICLIGRGYACCRYLTAGSNGWSCEKLGPLKQCFDQMVAAQMIVARGDNCAGKNSR